MIPPSVTGEAVLSRIILIGQAPGDKEPKLQKPFAWTAGKTLFKWFGTLGVNEEQFRQSVYMAALCRCFPGKRPKGGDRPPSKEEIQRCGSWLQREIEILQPQLVIPVGKMAIGELLGTAPLKNHIGQLWSADVQGRTVDIIPLPHPSGASTWHVTEPGKELLQHALKLIQQHEAWKITFTNS